MLNEINNFKISSHNDDDKNIKDRIRNSEDGKHKTNSSLPMIQKEKDLHYLDQMTKEQHMKLEKLLNKYGMKDQRSVQKMFPYKLMKILNKENTDKVITWKPHGRAFIVNKPKKSWHFDDRLYSG